MGYERNERRPYGDDRYGRESGRGDYGRSNYDRGNYGSGGRPSGYDYDDRGFFQRAGDEVRSWFGDEEAERRRRYDERYDDRYDRNERGGYGGGARGDFGRDDYSRGRADYGRSSYGAGDQGRGASYGGQSYGGQSQGGWRDADRDSSRDRGSWGGFGAGQSNQGWGSGESGSGGHHDQSYRSWRDRQMESFDRDYSDYRRENQSRFESEFGSYRTKREGQRGMIGKVTEHMEVVGSDGQHVGKVDHVQGDRIKLTKNDEAAGGHHHTIPSSWIESVDDKVTLSKTADQAKQAWREEQDSNDQGGGSAFGRSGENRSGDWSGDRNLNRSFSGTY